MSIRKKLMLVSLIWTSICLASTSGFAQTATQVKRTAEKTVGTDIETQEAVEAWLAEERRLLAEIDAVNTRLKRTAWQRQKTARYRDTLEKKVAELNQRAAEMERISQELLWVLDQTLDRLDAHVNADLPYDQTDRRKRLRQIRRTLDDYDLGLMQKTQAVFDAVAREVDMGHGVDVRDIEITVAGQLKQVKLLRVGRVGLYALTMDTQSAYVWDGQQREWAALAGSARAIEEAIEMAEGTRIVGLSRLPVGQPVKYENTGGDTVDQE